MKERLYRNAILSLVLINLWTLYSFFNFLKGQDGLFGREWDLFTYFGASLLAGCGIGAILIVLRSFVFKNSKKTKIQYNIIYIFTAIFNLNLFTIWLVTIILKLLSVDWGYIYLFATTCGVTSCYILRDIYKSIKDQVEPVTCS
jgi:hypothetical protein